MAEKVIAELESAAQVVLAPPNVVTQEQRQAAENVLLSFRRSKMPYGLCREIMERSSNDYVLFQVAVTIKECVLREWTLLQPNDIELLRNFLLQYVTQHMQLAGYVREQILQAVAVIIKRGTVDTSNTDRESLFQDVTKLISSGNMSMQLVACAILTALLNEYSTTSRSSSIGLTWEFHNRCKRMFEQNDLKRVFAFCLQMLGELERVPSPMNREVTAVLNRFLSILDQVLNWVFLPKDLPRKIVMNSFSTATNVSFKPPASWRDMVLDRNLMDMLFRIHRKVRHNSEMAHHSLQCLSQLASLNGAVFAQDSLRTQFLGHFISAFLDLNSCIQLQDYEALGLASVVGSLILFSPISAFKALAPDLLQSFVQNLTQLTCNFGQAAAREEAMHKEDMLYMEAYDKLLNAWTYFVADASEIPADSLAENFKMMFNSYLQCHLAAPEGTRDKDALGEGEEEEFEEIEEDDRHRFRDQLSNMGEFARQVPAHSIPLLTRLLEERVSRMHGQLGRMSQHNQGATSPGGPAHPDMTVMNTINEDLHWLLLVAGFTLMEECEGETPMIPSSIMAYAISQTPHVNIDTTLEVLASPGNEIRAIPGSEAATDPVVRLISAVFRLCEVERRAVEARLMAYLSPQVSSTVMWFLGRWTRSYLLPEEDFYAQISKAILVSFGRDTEGAQWTITFLLEKIMSNLSVWSSEEDLLADTLNLLVAMLEKKHRCDYVVRCPSIWKLAKEASANQPPYDMLSPTSKRSLYRGLVLAGGATFEGDTKENYWKLVLEKMNERLQLLGNEEQLRKTFKEERVKTEVLGLLEAICGIAEATRLNTVEFLFTFILPPLNQGALLIDIYHNYEEVIQMVLEMFHTVANRQILYLNPTNCSKFYSATLAMVEIYAKHNIGRQALSEMKEEEKTNALVTLMQLFNNLVVKEFIDFGWDTEAENGGEVVSAADVMFLGLQIVVPLMNGEVLKMPGLCSSYFYLLSSAADFPEKLCNVSPDLFKNILASAELGLTGFGPDITKLVFEFLNSMATHAYLIKNAQLSEVLGHFLKMTFRMLLLDNFEMEMLETAGAAMYALACCNQPLYKSLVTELLNQQTDRSNYDRLAKAFNELTPPEVELSLDRRSKIQFNSKFDKFLTEVRSFLCVR